MSKPQYYKLASGSYVALNRAAKRMFKKQGIEYRLPNQIIKLEDLLPDKIKTTKENEDEPKRKVRAIKKTNTCI